MQRRILFGRLAAIAAAVTLAPAVEASPALSTGYGLHATWYLEQNRDGAWLIIDQASGDVYTGAPSDEMLDAIAAAMNPAPLTFEAMQADCAARGCSLVESPGLSGYVIIHGHPDVFPPWPTFGPFAVLHGPLTPTGLARVDAWRTELHEQAEDVALADLVRRAWPPREIVEPDPLLTTIEYVGLSHRHGVDPHTMSTSTGGNPHHHTIVAESWQAISRPPVGSLAAWPADAPIPLGWRLLPELDARLT